MILSDWFHLTFKVVATNLQLSYTNISVEPFSHLSSDDLSGITIGTPNEAIVATYGSPGAGHGGNSGKGRNQNHVGVSYGNFRLPIHQGSRGGKTVFPFTSGRGGGRLSLHASHTLIIDGSVTARGGDGSSAGSGGGSGGSILVNATYFHGDGEIRVTGGQGNDVHLSQWHNRRFTGRKFHRVNSF